MLSVTVNVDCEVTASLSIGHRSPGGYMLCGTVRCACRGNASVSADPCLASYHPVILMT